MDLSHPILQTWAQLTLYQAFHLHACLFSSWTFQVWWVQLHGFLLMSPCAPKKGMKLHLCSQFLLDDVDEGVNVLC
uniref:Uncharacterized protein n=1 Tax=Arundo donax TaxID=35708 RepID=A0A0A9DS20_ARUDO